MCLTRTTFAFFTRTFYTLTMHTSTSTIFAISFSNSMMTFKYPFSTFVTRISVSFVFTNWSTSTWCTFRSQFLVFTKSSWITIITLTLYLFMWTVTSPTIFTFIVVSGMFTKTMGCAYSTPHFSMLAFFGFSHFGFASRATWGTYLLLTYYYVE